jgi:hypothetical protein
MEANESLSWRAWFHSTPANVESAALELFVRQDASALVRILPMAQDETLDFKIAGTLNLGFFVVGALLLWPLGEVGLVWQLFKGYFIYWIVLVFGIFLGLLLQRVFRIEDDPPGDAYIILNILLSVPLQIGWSAFVALSVNEFAANEPWWLQAILYFIGFLSAYLTLLVIQAFYRGSIYRHLTSLVGLAAFILFALWPASARFLFGWFFGWFG